MTDALLHARDVLEEENCTCVLFGNGKLYKSKERGVRPLLEFLDSEEDFRGFSASDKVVGKAAAFLYCLLGVKEVYAHIISQAALQVLQEAAIAVDYQLCVPAIRNRTNTGFCPMELATANITQPREALAAIKNTLKSLQGEKMMGRKPVLVVMAAGMGSRYGGLKQIDPVGAHGEAILDYSLYDAYEAGFETAVIVIKEAIRADFMQTVGARLQKSPMEIRYAYQELDKLPEPLCVPQGRTKPWGTAHAVLSAAQAVDGAPFAVINADDYYGKAAFKEIYQYLSDARDKEKADYCMVCYQLGNTVTEHGFVSRGVCEVDENGNLIGITERVRIEKHADAICYTEDDGITFVPLSADTSVSMNLFGFTPSFMEALAQGLTEFFEEKVAQNPLKAEYQLPTMVSKQLNEGKAQLKVLHSADKWYGVTYAADKIKVVAALQAFCDKGLYPKEGLWN